MPELPEVEVVRLGLAPALNGATVQGVEVRDARSLRRHAHDLGDFTSLITGARLSEPVRRGKFLWVPFRHDRSLLAHLGMSGQLLVRREDAEDDRHVRVRLWLEHPVHKTLRIDFADQRIFGSLAVDRLVPTTDGFAGGFDSAEARVPSQVAHIARDPLDPHFDEARFVSEVRRRSTAIKRTLLNQQLVSGIGNIYADEALWAARVHPETPGQRLSVSKTIELLNCVRDVFTQALAEGGTSFDAQYVNVNGQAGYFAHSLNAYGRHGAPCPRCQRPVVRVAFMNRSSHFCSHCQRRRK